MFLRSHIYLKCELLLLTSDPHAILYLYICTCCHSSRAPPPFFLYFLFSLRMIEIHSIRMKTKKKQALSLASFYVYARICSIFSSTSSVKSQSRLCGNFFGSLKTGVSHRLANHFFEFHRKRFRTLIPCHDRSICIPFFTIP